MKREEEEAVVVVAEAVGTGWNKVTDGLLVDRCAVVCLLAPTVVYDG